jgi:glycosyltransferase involved in cell wall biosynthesis
MANRRRNARGLASRRFGVLISAACRTNMAPPYRLLSVIIPVYNEQATIAEVVEKVAAASIPLEKEIIIVDDGSTDDTPAILRSVEAQVSLVHIAPANAGKGAAIRTGMQLARGDILIIQDADLELDPNEYRQLLQPILDGRCKVVYGSRFLADGNRVPLMRKFANRSLTTFTNLLYRTSLTDMETAYKVFTSDAIDGIELVSDRFEIEPEITAKFARRGLEIVEVPITYCPRTRDEGKKIKWHDGIRAVRTLIRHRLG